MVRRRSARATTPRRNRRLDDREEARPRCEWRGGRSARRSARSPGRCPSSPCTERRNPRCRSRGWRDRKSTRLNSSHANISYAVFCLKKKKKKQKYIWFKKKNKQKRN